MLHKVGARYGRYEDFVAAPIHSIDIGATTFCFFLQTQGFNRTSMSSDQLLAFQENMGQCDIAHENVFVHASYDLNLCEWNQRMQSKTIRRLGTELKQAHDLGISVFNVHVGSCPRGIAVKDALKSASDMLDEVMDKVPGIIILLENSTGFAAQRGGLFEEIRQIMEMSAHKERIGFSLNTSHAFSYGYDFRTQSKYQQFISEFDQVIGLANLKLMFFNDSKTAYGAKTDIHENLGHGMMGYDPFHYFLSDTRLNEIPIILETPDTSCWSDEIKMIHQARLLQQRDQRD